MSCGDRPGPVVPLRVVEEPQEPRRPGRGRVDTDLATEDIGDGLGDRSALSDERSGESPAGRICAVLDQNSQRRIVGGRRYREDCQIDGDPRTG